MCVPTVTYSSINRIEGPYKALRYPEFIYKGLSIRSIDPGDIEAIRCWRNAQMDVLRQAAEISAVEQIAYFKTHVWPEKITDTPRQILFVLEQENILVGYGGLVNVDWGSRRAEVSFLLDDKLEENSEIRSAIFESFLKLMQIVGFDELKLDRLFTETYAIRTRHINTLEAAGFVLEGILRQHVTINGQKVNSLIHGMIESDR